MKNLVKYLERPGSEGGCLLAGWYQWADAGSISSGLPGYLIDYIETRRVAEILPDGFYLFQVPGMHHHLRPEVKLDDGYPVAMQQRNNDFFYAGDEHPGLYLFLGEEPHMNEQAYADAFLSFVQEMNIKRVVAVGGVYGSMPYERDRRVSCTYSLAYMHKELEDYAVRFSNYQGGTTIGSHMVHRAQHHGIEFITWNAFVPAYDFAPHSRMGQEMRIETDYRAWHELTRRFNHMFDLNIDLSELSQQSNALTATLDSKLGELDREVPQLGVQSYLDEIAVEFDDEPFSPLDDLWSQELGDIFDGVED